jgi:hypothetical protein
LPFAVLGLPTKSSIAKWLISLTRQLGGSTPFQFCFDKVVNALRPRVSVFTALFREIHAYYAVSRGDLTDRQLAAFDY